MSNQDYDEVEVTGIELQGYDYWIDSEGVLYQHDSFERYGQIKLEVVMHSAVFISLLRQLNSINPMPIDIQTGNTIIFHDESNWRPKQEKTIDFSFLSEFKNLEILDGYQPIKVRDTIVLKGNTRLELCGNKLYIGSILYGPNLKLSFDQLVAFIKCGAYVSRTCNVCK